jgi:hypothetical protein
MLLVSEEEVSRFQSRHFVSTHFDILCASIRDLRSFCGDDRRNFARARGINHLTLDCSY